jgi:hypothetical protein
VLYSMAILFLLQVRSHLSRVRYRAINCHLTGPIF